jgi:hypothetical protein
MLSDPDPSAPLPPLAEAFRISLILVPAVDGDPPRRGWERSRFVLSEPLKFLDEVEFEFGAEPGTEFEGIEGGVVDPDQSIPKGGRSGFVVSLVRKSRPGLRPETAGLDS